MNFRVRRKFSWLFSAILLTLGVPGGSLHAEPPRESPYYGIYRQVAGDLGHDLLEFDGLELSAQERKGLARSWETYLGGTGASPLADPTSSLSRALPPQALPDVPGIAMTPSDLRPLPIPVLSGKPHSIQDSRQYSRQRLGPGLASLIEKGAVSVEIYGGETATLIKDMKANGRTLERIPSLYDSWGIEKFLEVTAGQAKPRVIIRVPPIEQFTRHYGMLVSLMGAQPIRVAVNESDRKVYRERMKSSVSDLYAKLERKPDYVVLGYGRELGQQLTSEASPWKPVTEPRTVTLPDGLKGTLYVTRNAKNPSLERSFLAVGHSQTIWGEGSAFLADGFLAQKPKGIAFLGSAGAPGPVGSVYDVTVPGEFLTESGKVSISNDLVRFRPPSSRPGRVHYQVRHGNTSSPAEQSLDYVNQVIRQGIHTIDVEQSLVADAVAAHNRSQGGAVSFLAANVVTDKPSSEIHRWDSGHDLTRIDPARKGEAKALAVSSVLEAIDRSEDWAVRADELRKAAIQRALPEVDAARIMIRNGQGKIDADPEHKLSYFLFTENPRDPASRTVVIPMATSRFDVYNYQTDEWWDAHKAEIEAARRNGTPVPRQDPAEVRAYLRDKGLSTNPDVLSIDPQGGAATRTPLREFLLQEYMERFTGPDGKVALYRGAEKPGELASWERGEFPRGVRYWTPDANYAWRYGRKSPDFIENLLKGDAPVFEYRVPKEEFVRLARGGHLILGTELTKRVHDRFAMTGKFDDQLNGFDYLGEGKYGLEFEARAARVARQSFARYFTGAVDIDNMADQRIRLIREGTHRLATQRPEEAQALETLARTRIAKVEAERKALKLARDGASLEEREAALAAFRAISTPAEITLIDGADLRSAVMAVPVGGAGGAGKPAAGCASRFSDLSPEGGVAP